jgi:hypothetical protein
MTARGRAEEGKIQKGADPGASSIDPRQPRTSAIHESG